MKKIGHFFNYLFQCIQNGFFEICLIFSKGFFFFFFFPFYLLYKLFNLKLFNKISNYFRERQYDPVSFTLVVLVFFIGAFLHTYFYVSEDDITYVDSNILDIEPSKVDEREQEDVASTPNIPSEKEINLYRKYGAYDLDSVSFVELKKVNPEVVAWLRVDGTNVNYPIVQTTDNDYYLGHDIMKNPKSSGWTFMDYRNSIKMDDSNTIFYGHNLLNKTSFGSLSNVFTDQWFQNSNHYIVVLTEEKKYVYEVFSCYYIDPEVYYLQNNFYTADDYREFLKTITSRSIYTFDIEVTTRDKIITLSTCTDDNKGRRVIHAKLKGD